MTSFSSKRRWSSFLLFAVYSLRSVDGTTNLRTTRLTTGGRILSIEDFGAVADKQSHWTFDELEESNEKTPKKGLIKELFIQVDEKRNIELAQNNTNSFNSALEEAKEGDTVLVPDGKSFTFLGGIVAKEKHGITIDIAGSTHFVHDLDSWPYGLTPRSFMYRKFTYDPAFTIFNCTSLVMTSSSPTRARVKVDYKKDSVYLVDSKHYKGGIINGNGKWWWDDAISGRLPGKKGESRPRLIHVIESEDFLMEKLTLLNSPYWTVTLEAIRAEVKEVNILIDREYHGTYQERRNEASSASEDFLRGLEKSLGFPIPIDDLPDWIGRKFRQPQDLNTDGIDPIGKDIHVHDCIIQNSDDSIAVKPSRNNHPENSRMTECTQNITMENLVLTGFGASVGSVSATSYHDCIDDVTFRNISMPGTGKGIYVKANGGTCREGKSGQITNILYENVRMFNPFWWAIWIGPQQQHEPNTPLGLKCSLTWPVPSKKNCPASGCVLMENITLRDIHVKDPWLSPGVIMGNDTLPISNIIVDGLTVKNSYNPLHGRWPFHDKSYPWNGRFKCENANGYYNQSSPSPHCLTEMV